MNDDFIDLTDMSSEMRKRVEARKTALTTAWDEIERLSNHYKTEIDKAKKPGKKRRRLWRSIDDT